MPSRKTPADRRANLPREIDFAKTFRKDWDRLKQAGRLDLNRLTEVMTLLFENRGPLGPEWSDHELSGRWSGHRECHVGGDFLLIYKLRDDGIVFVRAGTHSELFD